ncbi:MAG: ribose 5-phosphate isomerase B [Spirochaetales bacterium]|nr:ribose 5-phosphate isomerase B [Spirochaetales bacterium]
MHEQDRTVVVGSDHGGTKTKEDIKTYFKTNGYAIHDCGVFSEDSVDYPDTTKSVCREYLGGQYTFGVVVCGTGIGASIAANKVPGIRCALIHDLYTAEMAKAHNNANILAFGGRVKYSVSITDMLDRFVETEFLEGRHLRRVKKLSDMDKR